jgi:hypothetical protein
MDHVIMITLSYLHDKISRNQTSLTLQLFKIYAVNLLTLSIDTIVKIYLKESFLILFYIV